MTTPDQIDIELLPVFIEEGEGTLPKIKSLWQSLSHQNHDVDETIQQLKRHLHTLKGSARMIGAMVLGQYLHDLETIVKTISEDDVVSSDKVQQGNSLYDAAMQIFDELVRQAAKENEEKMDHASAYPLPKKEDTYIRVPAKIIDQILNQSGEMAIIRAYVRNEGQVLQQVIQELASHIDILDRRIRHIQMQTDMQVRTLRHKELTDKDFDALELDQFTYFQELTHQMAGDISDISSLRKHLLWTMRNVSTHIDTQAKLNKQLQSDIISTRMVMVQEIEDRLQRLVRQVAEETQKQIALTIVGGDVQLDRYILTMMTPAFEHLIRNAIVHGLETPAERLRQGKPATGHIHLIVTDESGEIGFQFTDDGKGISLEYVHQRAVDLGLKQAADTLSMNDVLDIIVHPEFSTAEHITALSGRGVGMDIVSAEVNQLGGRIQLHTTEKVGTQFMIHVPLTLSTMRIILVMVGGQTYGIPLPLIQHIVRRRDLMQSDTGVKWMKKPITLVSLNKLLRQPVLTLDDSEGIVLILKSESVQQGLLVDNFVGNQEIVLKPLAPSWVKVDGVIGAGVLGNGQIVLIIQPPILIQKYLTYRGGMAIQQHASFAVQKTIMVVDDALTVRRVLKKLLEKANYRVIVAKDGQDALLHLPTEHPDLVLLDVEMPRMDGFRLLKEIRANTSIPHVPVIMMTSRIGKKHQQRAKTLGADAYLGKPYQQDKLLLLIEQLLRPQSQS